MVAAEKWSAFIFAHFPYSVAHTRIRGHGSLELGKMHVSRVEEALKQQCKSGAKLQTVSITTANICSNGITIFGSPAERTHTHTATTK